MPTRGLRLMVWDRTCFTGQGMNRFLGTSWWAGSALYRAMGRFDATLGASSWDEALAWLSRHREGRAVDSIEFWGHGKWGAAFIGGDRLDASWLDEGHPRRAAMDAIRGRMGPSSRWWFRTCETLGAKEGHDFARRWSRFFGGRVAGHTYVIGAWQSGLHSLGPGEEPDWSVDEGIDARVAGARDALPSRWGAPNTVTFLHDTVPRGW